MGRADLAAFWPGSPSPPRKLKKLTSKGSTSSSSEVESDSQSNEHVTDIFEDTDLYLLAKNGNVDDFRKVLDRISAAENVSYVEILSRVNPAGDTLLHVAVKHGNKIIVTYIAEKDPYAIFDVNFSGDTALHIASKAGDESMVRTLVLFVEDTRELPSAADIVAVANNLVMAQNKRGNTSLLEALNNGRESIALYLIQAFPELSYIQNKKGESALYMAAKSGFMNGVNLILELCIDQIRIKELFKKMSPIKVAIMTRNRDVLEGMFNRNPCLIQVRDDEERTPLHIAVFLGHLEEVRYFLNKDSSCANKRDKYGLFPIHLASIQGHVDIVDLLLDWCRDPSDMLDNHGCSVLHLAAKNGRYSVVKYMLNNPDFEEQINMEDYYGNTPLHLASMDWHPKIVSVLTWDNRVDVKLVNNMGRTAIDVADCTMWPNPTFRQRLTWTALKAAGTPRSPSGKSIKGRTSAKSYLLNSCKERVNTLLLVSTLVATITFAAGFTLPGGYNNSVTDLGMATMLRHRLFHIFVFCDIIAMHCSIIVAVTLIFAQLGDLNLVLTALNLALPLLGVALSMMSMAFTAGISLVVGKLRWLSITILVTGITFLVILLLLFVPLCSPITSTNKILRYLSYYSFSFLMLATKSYD